MMELQLVCKECGTVNDRDAKFCKQCGKPKSISSEPTPRANKCPTCGAYLPIGSTCTKCTITKYNDSGMFRVHTPTEQWVTNELSKS